MRRSIKMLWVLLLLCSVAGDRDKSSFLGGTISYTTTLDTNGKYKADVELITGWILGNGPCGPSCTNTSIGTSTLSTRKQLESVDPNVFGKFFVDSNEYCAGVDCVDYTIKHSMTEEVYALNAEARWEQDISKFSVIVDEKTEDINFQGDFWRPTMAQKDHLLAWHLQIQFSPLIRNDTNKPNSIPQVLGRPFYRVKLNEVTTLKMAVSDPDGDVVKCFIAEYVEGGDISSHKAPGLVVNEDCTITIDASTKNGYFDDSWIAVAMVIRDYHTKLIKYGDQIYNPLQFSMLYSNFQFMVNILKQLEVPRYVSPTPPNRHQYVLYIGVTWTIDLYAVASENTTISDFIDMSRPKFITMKTIRDDLRRERTRYTTLTWKPSPSDIGTRAACFAARDDTGIDSDEDWCILFEVLSKTFQSSNTISLRGKPVFVDIPTRDQLITCPVYATCVVPLYIKSAVEVVSVNIDKCFTEDAGVGPIELSPDHGQNIYRTDLTFTDSMHGEKQLCFTAVDKNGAKSEDTCVMSEIEPLNPCISNPCRNSAACSVDKRTGTFLCHCLPDYFGKSCENYDDPCIPNPCQNGGLCHKKGQCYCVGFTGDYCENDINYCTKNSTCSGHGACKDGKTNFTCECMNRFTGTDCETDTCQTVSQESASCPIASCDNVNCSGHGVCTEGGVCKCSPGYHGNQCETAKGQIQLNGDDIAFVSPSLQAGSTVICYLKNKTVTPCAVDAFVTTSSGVTPTIERKMSPELDIETIIRPVKVSEDVEGVTGVHYSQLIVKGNITSTTGQYACIIASAGTSEIERCYVIKLVEDPAVDSSTLQYAQINASLHFIPPTPRDGSTLICIENEPCNLVLYTRAHDRRNHDCKHVISTSKDVVVFAPHGTSMMFGPCVTEVVLESKGTVDRVICFLSALKDFQQRCFKIIVYPPNSDPCDKMPCKNGGLCLRTGRDDFKCNCPTNYDGDTCQNGPCLPIENICHNNAHCQKLDNTVSCICQLGFNGRTCNVECGNDTSTISTTFFASTAKPDTLQCVLNQPCSVASIIAGSFSGGSSPTVVTGYISPALDVVTLNTAGIQNNSAIVSTGLTLQGKSVGLHKACVQVKDDTGSIADENCFKINIVNDVISVYGFQDRPYFIEPSLPTSTTVHCTINDTCHVLYKVTTGEGNNDKCVSAITKVSGGSLSTHLYTTCDNGCEKTGWSGSCSIDVAFATPAIVGQKSTVCIELSIKSPPLVGEQRCFDLTVVAKKNVTEHEGCRWLQCKNNGFCDGRDASNPFCICPRGYSGPTCDKDTTHVDPSGSRSTNYVGDNAITEEIVCGMFQVCAVPFQIVQKPGENTSLQYGYKDHHLTILKKRSVDNSTGSILVMPTAKGIFNFCQQIVDGSFIKDEMCSTIKVQDLVIFDPKDGPYFTLPTLFSESTVICDINISCHIDINFMKLNKTDHSQFCPDLIVKEETTIDKIHIFDVNSTSNDCVKDVSVIHEREEKLRLCLQLVVTGKRGEIRCFNIKFVDNVYLKNQHPCRNVECLNGGKCLPLFKGQTPTSKCICRNGFHGNNCENGSFNTTWANSFAVPGSSDLFCPPNDVCHILFSSDKLGSTCSDQEFKVCGQGISGYIYPPVDLRGKCYTDVAFITEEVGTSINLCADSRTSHKRMTVQVQAYGLCRTLICKNGGTCKSKSSTEAVCECPENFAGQTCEKDMTSHFNSEYALPKILTCEDTKPCCFTIAHSGPENNLPTITGHDMDLSILSGPEITPHESITNAYITRTCVSGTVDMQHKLCMALITQLKSGLNVTERMCLLIEITPQASTQSIAQPRFDKVLPDGSNVLCKPYSGCTLPLVTTPKNGICEKVRVCGNNTKILLSTPVLANGTCKSTAAWINQPSDHTATICLLAGRGGEERHFLADVTELKFSDNSPCMTMICNHGGKCIEDKTSAPHKGVCLCRLGYEGSTCEKVSLSKAGALPGVIGVNSSTANQHFVPEFVVPKTIQCDEVNPCCVNIPYYGNPSIPPPLGYFDNKLTILSTNTTSAGLDLGAGNKKYFNSMTCVKGVPGQLHRVCFQTTKDGTNNGMNVDELCFKVQVNHGGQSNPVNGPRFDKSSLQNGSSVICQLSTECHMPVSTMSRNGTCDKVSTCTQTTDVVHVFNTKLIDGKCLTDIAYKSETTGNITVCLSAGPSGEKRTLEIETKDMTSEGFGPCQKVHCKNGGRCMALSSTHAQCDCKDEYWGPTCDNSYCLGIDCKNNGKCIVDGTSSPTKGVCLCPANFAGAMCDSVPLKEFSLQGIENVPGGITANQHFVGQSAIPSGVQCDAVNPCCISIPYSGNANLPPIIGYHDKSLTIDSGPYTLPAEDGTSGSYISVVCVKGSTDQLHKLCLQTTTNGTKDGMNMDEFCTNITISNKNNGNKVNESLPYFDNATLTDGTRVVCNPMDVCHLLVITAKLNETCSQVEVCQPSPSNVNVFNTKLVNDKCISDIAMKTGVVGSETLCLSAGNSGEERHYVVETKDNSHTGFGSCQKLHCKNGGSCTHDSVSDKPICECPYGLIGELCDQDVCDSTTCMNNGACIVHNTSTGYSSTCICTDGFTGTTCNRKDTSNSMVPGVTKLPTNIVVQQHFKGNNAVPDVVTCDEKHECCIPIEYSGNKSYSPILGHYDNDLKILSGPQTIQSGTGSHLAVTCVQGTPGKSQRLCLQTTTNGTKQGMNVDEICVKINTETGGDLNTQEHHFLSTLPNGTHVICKPNSQCHIPVITSANKTSCDQVTSCGTLGDGTHAFPTRYINGTCITDISIQTEAAGTTINTCISAGLNGEHREFVIEVKDPTGNGFGGPCQKLHCHNGGVCQSFTDDNATCACPLGFVGQDCDKQACEKTTCSNGGLCIADSTHPQGFCICTIDYDGTYCEQGVSKTTVFLGTKDLPSGVTPQQHFIGSSGVPKVIMCDENKPCCFSVPYLGNTDLPPTIGYHDRNLNIIDLPTSLTPDNAKPNYHLATTCVDGKVGLKSRLCLQTTTDGTQSGINVDEICVEVQVNNKAENGPVSSSQPHFNNSLPDGSVIVCQPDSVCHIPIITAKTAGSCSDISLLNQNDINGHILSVKPYQDKCISDVAVLTGKDGETKHLSISAGPGGEERHYTIETRNTTSSVFGPCGQKHCQNGGRCKAYTTNTATCVCPVHFTGDHCETRLQKISACQSVTCKNGGFCTVDNKSGQNRPQCVCAVGFTGNTCDKVEVQLPLPVINGVSTVKPPEFTPSSSNQNPLQNLDYSPQTFFNKTALPQYIKCDPLARCCLPITYHGDRKLPPMLGYHYEDLTVIPDREVFTLSPNNKTHIVDICVTGKPNTIHRLCVQTTTNGTIHGVNLDEVCVEIEMKTPDSGSSNSQVSAPGPHFVTNFPDGTELVCKPNSVCHIPVVTETTDGLCEQVTQCLSGLDVDIHTFDTQKKDGRCITDIAVQTENKENMMKHVCLSAGSHGENINFDVKATHQTAFGPCRELHCLNGGKCLSVKSGLSPLCLCPKEYTGVACETGTSCGASDTQFIKEMVSTGNAKCSCVVNGKEVNIIKKKPVPTSKEIYIAAGFGAGGMIGTMVVGIIIYVVVTRLQGKKPTRNRPTSSRISPIISPKRKQAHLKNMDF